MLLGEIISLVVAVSWTATALFAEIATKRVGQLTMNVARMIASLILLGATLWIFTGSPLPLYADQTTWMWLSLSGFVGYVLGDYCLFNSYIVIGSRFGQLFMTLASPFAALAAWILLGETLSWTALLGMFVCMSGIGMSVLSRGDEKHVHFKLPLRGILLGIGAGAGQGVGLVLSKVGMAHYSELVPATDEMATNLIPFASTMMRAVMGLIAFSIAMAYTRQFHKLPQIVHDRKAFFAGMGAVILGPFIGVSLSLMAVQMAPAGVAQTLMSLTPIFILLPSKMLYKTRITPLEVIGAIIAVAGASLLFL
ncbi:MAG: DMT family transporter [Bacteroidaceae bacterium]|nr:DMT family transporter [Bacteroidaceae bacterium]